MRRVAAHAQYDDAHPREALELVKLTVRDAQSHQQVAFAIRRALQLLRRAFDSFV